MQRVIGIDFGTSTTYMNVKRYNGNKPAEDAFSYMPVMFNYGESSGYVATIIRENADGTFDFGEKAAEEMDGARIYTEIKMQLENPDDARRNEARRMVKEFFKFLYATYSQQAANLGGADDTEETVISYPVKWQEDTAEFMLEAAREAGFKNVRGMDEATAAISTVLCHNAGKDLVRSDCPGYLLLVDMGAGTTDLVVCRYQADSQGHLKVELVSNWPRDAHEPCFGGREVDRVLEGYVEAYLSKALNPVLAPNAHGIASTPGAAKQWKERNVSVNLAANKPVTNCTYISTYRSMGMLSGNFPEFDRKAFEKFAREGLGDYVKLLEGCLTDTARKDADFEAAGVDLVILTGGHSSWYFAREIVDGTMEGYLNHPSLAQVRERKDHVVNLPNPQTTVSLGLVYSKLPFNLSKAAPQSPPVIKEEHKLAADTPTYRDWYIKILPVLREVVSTDPKLVQTNHLDNAGILSEIQERFSRAKTRIPGNEQILYAGLMCSYPQRAILMTNVGIYRCQGGEGTAPGQVSFMTWRHFANSVISRADDRKIEFGYEGDWIQFFDDDLMNSVAKLHERLRKEVDMKPVGPDAELLKVVLKVIANAPDLQESNQVNNELTAKLLKETFKLISGEKLLYAENGGSHNTLMTNKGIYQREVTLVGSAPIRFMSWREFAHSTVTQENYQIRTYVSKGTKIITSIHWNTRSGVRELYNALRDTLGIEQAKPHKWDSRLLPIVKKFVQENETLKERSSCLGRYQPAQLMTKLELSHMSGDEIYYAADDYDSSVFGRDKQLITSSGFGMRYYGFWLGYSGDIITWEEFMEADLNDPSGRVYKVVKALKLVQDFTDLQTCLRQEAEKLA